MAENVRLNKTVREKQDLNKVVSKEFTTFLQPQQIQNNDTVEELFRLYTTLYLDIPLDGPLSHKYLIEESSKLVDIEQELDIQPLLDEISDLRQRLLEANEYISELEKESSNV